MKARDLANACSYKWEPRRTGGLIPLDVADIDLEPPLELAARVLKECVPRTFGYGTLPQGYLEAVCSWHARHYSATIEPDWVLETAGSLFGLAMALRAVSEPGAGVVVFKPGFGAFEEIACAQGRVVVPVELKCENGVYSIDFDALEAAFVSHAPQALVLCNPHNPTGTEWGADQLSALGELCQRYCVSVISDEVHADYAWVEEGHCSVLSAGVTMPQDTVLITAPTKTFNISGMQEANIICRDGDVVNRIRQQAFGCGIYSSNSLALALTQALYEEGEAWLEQARLTIKGNLEMLAQVCSQSALGLCMCMPDAGYLAWIDGSHCAFDIVDRSRAGGYLVSDGVRFGEGGKNHARIGVACSSAIIQKYIEVVISDHL